MKKITGVLIWGGLIGFILFAILFGFDSVHSYVDFSQDFKQMLERNRPKSPKLSYSVFRTAPVKVAMVFGRSQGCNEVDGDFINEVADTAARNSLDPSIAAATIAVESSCNPYAISNRGAVGLMQINVKVWKDTFDFSDKNLFNAEDNLHVGTTILSDLIRQYGVREAVARYQGLGPNGDPGYTDKILNLARRQ